MLVPVLVVGGIAWLLLREGRDKPDVDPTPTPEPEPTTPDPSTTEWTETASWSGEYAEKGYDGTERVVWVLKKGIRYRDGSTQMDDSEFILIGNKTHTAFRSANSDRGTIDIKKEYTGGDADVKNAIVYASLANAEAKVRELSQEPEYDPTDPTQPRPEPEDDDDGSSGGGGFGGLPASPGYQLGQGMGSSAF